MTYHYSQVEIREVLISVEKVLNTISIRSRRYFYYEKDREEILKELLVVQLREFNRD